MIKIGVCIETVFTDMAYTERARKVAELGFSGISFWHYDQQYEGVHSINQPKDIDAIERVLRETVVYTGQLGLLLCLAP